MGKIKVLWLMNDLLADYAAELGMPEPMGGWLPALSRALMDTGEIELGVASRVSSGNPSDITIRGIQHFIVPTPMKGYELLRPTKDMTQRYSEIINQFLPDIIHVHGTEWYGGLVTAENRMGRPSMIALQGLIYHHQRYLLGQLGFLDILKTRTLRDWITFRGLWEQKIEWNKRAEIELEIIKGHNIFEGRSLWDRAHLRRLNPDANYFYCDHIIRGAFYDRKWNIAEANRHTVFAPSARYPLKGFHVLIKAIAILHHEFPDIKIRFPIANINTPPGIKGIYTRMRRDGYSSYLADLIEKLKVGDHFNGIIIKTGEEMAEEMRCAHVFVLTSLVENNSNAMVEAMVVGVPSVVSLGGGIPSLISDGQTALGFAPGDEAVLAEQIRRIFLDDEFAQKLSIASREIERPRHEPEPIAQRMVAIYTAAARGEHPEYLGKSPRLELETV